MVPQYFETILDYMISTESLRLAKSDFMQSQNDINEKMRAILIDWLIEVQVKFKLLPETIFLTTNIIDRYLEKSSISRNKL